MIDLHYAPTPNGWKVSIMLEELGLPYRSSRSISGPATSSSRSFWRSIRTTGSRDRRSAPADGGEPFSVFESGAILIYLAEKTGSFLPADMRGRSR